MQLVVPRATPLTSLINMICSELQADALVLMCVCVPMQCAAVIHG